MLLQSLHFQSLVAAVPRSDHQGQRRVFASLRHRDEEEALPV